jgi:hypothetical protein
LPKEVSLTLRGKGHQLLLTLWRLKIDTLELNLADKMAMQRIPSSLFLDSIATAYPLTVRKLTPDTFVLAVERKVMRRVPILPALNIQLKEGYLFTSPPRCVPDSVLIIGTESDIKNITYWQTQDHAVPHTGGALQYEASVRASAEIAIQPPKVTVIGHAERFVEEEIERSVSVLNLPYSQQLRMLPSRTVKLRYRVPFSKSGTINTQDFRAAVDAQELTPDAQYAIIQVTQKPKDVYDVRVEPPWLRYVITTK